MRQTLLGLFTNKFTPSNLKIVFASPVGGKVKVPKTFLFRTYLQV